MPQLKLDNGGSSAIKMDLTAEGWKKNPIILWQLPYCFLFTALECSNKVGTT